MATLNLKQLLPLLSAEKLPLEIVMASVFFQLLKDPSACRNIHLTVPCLNKSCFVKRERETVCMCVCVSVCERDSGCELK